jgi:hypothetical protein
MDPNKVLWEKGDFAPGTSIPATFLRVTVAV